MSAPERDVAIELIDHQRGAGLVEYALLVGLIAIVCVAAVTLLGESTSGLYSSVLPALD